MELYQKLTQRLRFTVYAVGSAADVGVIFEVMNNRGKPLSDLEKTKNYLLYLAAKLELSGDQLANRINSAWADIFQGLMVSGLTRAADENRLLRIHWLAIYDHSQKNWERTDWLKARFSLREYQGRHRELLEDLTRYTASLQNASGAACDAQAPHRDRAFAAWGKHATGAIAATEKLIRTRAMATFLPLLIAVRLRFPTEPEKYIDVTEFCERFAFRVYRVRGRRSNTGRSHLNWLAYKLYHGEHSFETTLQKGYAALRRYCSDEEFEQELAKNDNWYNWSGLRALLYAYEEHLASDRGVRVSWHEIEQRDLKKTIEHILPQTATRRYWSLRFKKPDRERWTHDIGNLVLTMHNAELSNRSFPDKVGKSTQSRPCYANSVLFQERELEQFDEWTPDTLTQRRQKLVAFARHRWAVPYGHRDAHGELREAKAKLDDAQQPDGASSEE